jgi:hypothetical protein
LKAVDPGADTISSWSINWGDGSIQPVVGNPNSVSHTYADGPNSYSISATATDEDGTYNANTLNLTVNNVPPILTLSGESSVDEGSNYTLNLKAVDPGADTISSWNINWGDGSIQPVVGNPNSVSHIYADGPNKYTISATATDEDGTYNANMLNVIVNNVPPMVNAGPDSTINEGSAFSSSGSFTDPGADTWTATVNYGDGSGVQPLALAPNKTFSLSHVYADNGSYTATVTVIDDDGGVGGDILQITVLNVPPTVEAGTDQTITAGDFTTFNGTFSDPGWLDTHTAVWDHGDGTSGSGTVTEEHIPPDSTGIVIGAHSFFKAGEFTVTLKVTDDDTGEGSDTLKMTVKAIAATIDFDPNTLNKKSGDKWVTVYIELPEKYDVWQTDGSTVLLNGIIPAHLGQEGWAKAESNKSNIIDHDGDGILERMVKFDRNAVKDILEIGDKVQVTVSGGVKYSNGHDTGLADFKGQDIIRVIEPGKGTKAAPALATAMEKGLDFAALSPYPQPSNPETWIPYSLPKDVKVVVRIYNASGALVRTLDLGHKVAGFYTSKDRAAYWDGRNDYGEIVSSGVYFYTIQAGEYTATRKMLLLK